MLIIRATEKLRKRWKVGAPFPSGTSTSVLGDLYAHVVSMGRGRVILGVFERTLLPLILPVAQPLPLMSTLRPALTAVLQALDVSPSVVDNEQAYTKTRIVTKTQSRVVLGVMNDFMNALSYFGAHDDHHQVAMRLGDTYLSPLKMQTPHQVTAELFKTRPDQLRQGLT